MPTTQLWDAGATLPNATDGPHRGVANRVTGWYNWHGGCVPPDLTHSCSTIHDPQRAKMIPALNADADVVEGFGDEWSRFDQSELSEAEHRALFDAYFHIFPWESLPPDAQGMDVGSGSGRWALLVAPRCGLLHCIDASGSALEVARRRLRDEPNVRFHEASVGDLPIDPGSLDFGYSLGVLHHVPDTEAGLVECVRRLRPGAPFLLYLYYAFDNRPAWFRGIWRVSDLARRRISRLPYRSRYFVSQLLAGAVYWPLARAARLLEKGGARVDDLPLSAYRDTSFYTMRTDALDRFGTRLEKRFTRAEMTAMMERAGLEHVRFSERTPHWCAVGYRKRE
jgi:ubiquinone/menaquinone biosynthesis C-methylase UbiE